VTIPRSSASQRLSGPHRLDGNRSASDLVLSARESERAGCIPEAVDHYAAAIAEAELEGKVTVLAEALRRLAALRYKRDECAVGRALCERSHEVARGIGDDVLAAEALNSMGAMLIRE